MLYEFEVIYNRKVQVLSFFLVLFVETCLLVWIATMTCVHVYDESPPFSGTAQVCVGGGLESSSSEKVAVVL